MRVVIDPIIILVLGEGSPNAFFVDFDVFVPQKSVELADEPWQACNLERPGFTVAGAEVADHRVEHPADFWVGLGICRSTDPEKTQDAREERSGSMSENLDRWLTLRAIPVGLTVRPEQQPVTIDIEVGAGPRIDRE